MLCGRISSGDPLLIGPTTESGHFVPVVIKSIHIKRIPMKMAVAGQVACLALRKYRRAEVTKLHGTLPCSCCSARHSSAFRSCSSFLSCPPTLLPSDCGCCLLSHQTFFTLSSATFSFPVLLSSFSLSGSSSSFFLSVHPSSSLQRKAFFVVQIITTTKRPLWFFLSRSLSSFSLFLLLQVRSGMVVVHPAVHPLPCREFESRVLFLDDENAPLFQVGQELVLHIGVLQGGTNEWGGAMGMDGWWGSPTWKSGQELVLHIGMNERRGIRMERAKRDGWRNCPALSSPLQELVCIN